MTRFVAIVLTTLALSIAVAAQEHTPRRPSAPAPAPTPGDNNGGWVKFTSDIGRFSVLMPETPEETIETTQSEHGPYTTHLFITRHDPNVYLIGWVDYDPSFNFNRQSELAANRDNFVKGIKSTLVSTRPIVLDGYQAIEFVCETAEKIYKSRVYMVGRRPYQIVIGYPKDQPDLSLVNRFFNSFKVKAY